MADQLEGGVPFMDGRRVCHGTNMDVLPFDRAFFAGGANGVRGWTVRDLGPGFAQQDALDAGYVPGVGDVQLDVGLEFRKELTDVFEAAWFTDAGNVWIHQTSSSAPAEEAVLPCAHWRGERDWACDSTLSFLVAVGWALRLYESQGERRWIGQASPRGMVHLGIGTLFEQLRSDSIVFYL